MNRSTGEIEPEIIEEYQGDYVSVELCRIKDVYFVRQSYADGDYVRFFENEDITRKIYQDIVDGAKEIDRLGNH